MSAGHFIYLLFIASPKSFPISALEFVRNAWVAVLIAVVHVWPAVVVEISSRPFSSILKSALLCLSGDVAVMSVRLVEPPVGLAHLPVALAHEVAHGPLVAAAKSFTVRFTQVE